MARSRMRRRFYENGLLIVSFFLFVVFLAGQFLTGHREYNSLSFTLHAFGGAAEYNEQRAAHGEPAITVGRYLMSSRFWFESFQNWQSEFLAVGSIVVLSIFLRQKGSPQSKPVDAPHDATEK